MGESLPGHLQRTGWGNFGDLRLFPHLWTNITTQECCWASQRLSFMLNPHSSSLHSSDLLETCSGYGPETTTTQPSRIVIFLTQAASHPSSVCAATPSSLLCENMLFGCSHWVRGKLTAAVLMSPDQCWSSHFRKVISYSDTVANAMLIGWVGGSRPALAVSLQLWPPNTTRQPQWRRARRIQR